MPAPKWTIYKTPGDRGRWVRHRIDADHPVFAEPMPRKVADGRARYKNKQEGLRNPVTISSLLHRLSALRKTNN